MTERLTQEQLAQIVGEVEQLARRREDELDRTQVEEILQELNLPPELLDEAIVQLSRRQALAKRSQRNRWIGIGVAAVLISAIALTTKSFYNQQQALKRVSASASYLSTQSRSQVLQQVDRQATPEVYYRVTLQDAPIGKKLSLQCNWVNPQGQIVHQNRYQTRPIDKDVWQTHCRYQFLSTAAEGNWRVEMLLKDRAIGSSSFTVR